MKFKFLFCLLLLSHVGQAQVVENSVNTESFDNFSNTYNFMYWDDSWKTTGVSTRSFTNQTSSYSLNVDFTNLNIYDLSIEKDDKTAAAAFVEPKSTTIQTNYDGVIDFSILQNGVAVYDKSSNPTRTGRRDSQVSEYGTWCNRRFVSANLTNSAPIDDYFTGVEFANWHNRFEIAFHVKPTTTITNGQLEFSIEIPQEYSQYLNSGNIHGFGLSDGTGFSVKAGISASTTSVNNNVITVTTASQDLLVNEQYEVSLVFYAVKQSFATSYATVFDEESQISITALQTDPVNTNVSNITYSEDEGIHYLDIPRYGMGYRDCGSVDVFQKIELELANSSSATRRVRLCFRQVPNVNVVGFNSLICNANDCPSGLQLQVSKNWHTGTAQYFSGSWIKEYTELIIPANTTLNLNYKRTGAKWGETYSASSHQLSVAGSGVPRGGWLEAALGSFGESVTHSPDYEFGSSNACDVRPFMVTNENYGGTSSECSWTGNSGGFDMMVYNDDSNARQYQSQVKTRFLRYSPNLTETSISAVSADNKLKLDYTFFLNRSDDFTRIYYKVKIKALQATNFSRLDIFQLGGDIYNIHNTQSLIYGNDTGVEGQIAPTNSGSNDYTTAEIALSGTNPWIWAGDGLSYNGANSGIDIDVNQGFIIREYKATIGGVENNTPYFRERSSSLGFSAGRGINPTSYCLVTPPGTTSLSANDEIELIAEVAVLPKINSDYYGDNSNFAGALTSYQNSYELLYRESLGNQIIAESPLNTIDDDYPLNVNTQNNEGLVFITGGRGYVPVKFTGLTSSANPGLWRAYDNCWELVDQSVNGKDFWQTDYNVEDNTFTMIFNVDQDIPNDSTAVISYFLGSTPPEPSIVIQSLVVGGVYTTNPNLDVRVGADSVVLAPGVTEYSRTSFGVNENWSWTGPNNFSQEGRVIRLYPVTSDDLGTYTATYTNQFGCSESVVYIITAAELPVELVRFNATPQKTSVLLTWETVNQINNLGFSVEHSKDGIYWESIGFVNGDGTSTILQEYKLVHSTPQVGLNYYRLKQMDFDGSAEYSSIETAMLSYLPFVSVLPNPNNGHFSVKVNRGDYTSTTIQILDLRGSVVWKENYLAQAGSQLIIEDIHLLEGQMYFLMVRQGDHQVVKKIVTSL